ncbi:MAG: hypothetical protein LBE95_01415 [Holosporaceae bacterium]|jgi:hypothetical protein|nr:hypothetical protein [Holosporaceae bacterium]
MSEIIYLKDLLLTKAATKKERKKNASPRAKLKPFKYEKVIKSFLIEKEKKEDRK